jgi:hypothetical protein
MRDETNTLEAEGEVPLKVGFNPELVAADERDIEPRPDHWRRACRWRLARILRFADRQKKQRAWISFGELAERYRRNIGADEGYKQLQRSVIDGKFERNGRSRVLYLHPAVTIAKMTRERMRNAVETYPLRLETVRRHYLAPCWIPRELADEWCQSWSRPDDQAPKEGSQGLSYERQEPQQTKPPKQPEFEPPKRKRGPYHKPARDRIDLELKKLYPPHGEPPATVTNTDIIRTVRNSCAALRLSDTVILRRAGRAK